MARTFRITVVVGVLIAFLGLLRMPAQGAESGTGVYLLGYQSSMAGFMPPPGFYLRNDFYWSQGNATALPFSGRVEANLRSRSFIDLLSLSYVSPLKIFEANYAAGILWVPFGNAFLKGNVRVGNIFAVSKEGDYSGVGDLILTPVLLGWHWKYFHIIAIGNVYAPVGSYNSDRTLNIGMNRWAIEPNVAVTFLHPKYGQEVSIYMGYTVNFRNSATEYTTGNEFHLDYFIGQHLPKGFALGLAGYVYQQVTGDSGPGAILGPFKGTAIALGPCLTFSTQIAGHMVGLKVRYYNEVHVKNRLDGQSLFATLNLGF